MKQYLHAERYLGSSFFFYLRLIHILNLRTQQQKHSVGWKEVSLPATQYETSIKKMEALQATSTLSNTWHFTYISYKGINIFWNYDMIECVGYMLDDRLSVDGANKANKSSKNKEKPFFKTVHQKNSRKRIWESKRWQRKWQTCGCGYL